jgi:hypothetical protein
MDEMILKHIRTLPVELVAASLAEDLSIEPTASSGYSYVDKEHGYIVRIEVVRHG